MSDRSGSPPEQEGRGPGSVLRGWYVLVPAAALVIGILLGALVVGVVGDDEQPEDASPEPTNTPTATDGTEVVVPNACLEAADTAEQIIMSLENGIGAIREFQEDRIRALLNELEDLEARARRQATECRRVSINDVPETPPTPTTPPS